MELRRGTENDLEEILDLFDSTIRNVNNQHYSQNQIEIWANQKLFKDKWIESINTHEFWVVSLDKKIIGFAALYPENLFKSLYVHHEHQGIGVASLLTSRIESSAIEKGLSYLHASVSITARPFFSKKGYKRVSDIEINLNGIQFINWKMQKELN